MSDKFGILFLCTGNSCRSQMAEGWAKYLSADDFHIMSAGIEAHGKNPKAIQVMAEAGVDISEQESTILSQEMLDQTDLLVTVCGHADENCPIVPSSITRIHWPIKDPAKAVGETEEILEVFRATRDEIKQRVAQLLDKKRHNDLTKNNEYSF